MNFTVSLFDILVADAKIADIAGIHMVARIKGDVKATFRQVDVDGNDVIDREEFRNVINRLGKEVSDEELDRCFKELDENDDGTIDFEEFSKWYLRSEARMDTDIRQIFERFVILFCLRFGLVCFVSSYCDFAYFFLCGVLFSFRSSFFLVFVFFLFEEMKVVWHSVLVLLRFIQFVCVLICIHIYNIDLIITKMVQLVYQN